MDREAIEREKAEWRRDDNMTREEKIEVILDDLPGWLKRDPTEFWDHVRDLERDYLKLKDDVELDGIYENSK